MAHSICQASLPSKTHGNAGGHACGVEWPSGDSIAGQIAGEESTQRLLMKQLILMAYCVATAARQMSQRGLKADWDALSACAATSPAFAVFVSFSLARLI